MKILFYLFYLIAISIVSCTTITQEPHEKAIKEYLKDNLDDPKSYQSVEFEIIDPNTFYNLDCYYILLDINEVYQRLLPVIKRINNDYSSFVQGTIFEGHMDLPERIEDYKLIKAIIYKFTLKYLEKCKILLIFTE